MLDIATDITRVYNGKQGCMCGCNGKYTTNPRFKELVGKERGYAVDNDECNERIVKIIAGKVLRNPNVKYEGNYAYLEQGNRIQVVYFR